MQKTLTRLFMAVMMAALLVSASIMSVSAATPTCPDADHADHTGWIAIDPTVTDSPDYTVTMNGDTVTYIRLITDGGKYYLPADVHVKTQFEIGTASSNNGTADANTNVTLCLNGHNLTGDATLIRVGEYCSLNLVNCVEDDATEAAAGVFTKGLVTAKNYSLMLRKSATANIGDNIHMDGRDSGALSIVSMQAGGGVVNMYGGTISNNLKAAIPDGKSVGYLGIVDISYGTFNMYGGKISGNTVTGDGIVYSNSGTFNMYGGEISGNAVSGNGIVYVKNAANMYGGSIKDNFTADDAKQSAVNVAGGTFTMYDGTISGHDGGTIGGGVLLGENSTFNMKGGTLTGNTAQYGAAVHLNKGTSVFVMDGGSITANTTTGSSNGGAVCTFSTSKFTMNGGSITNNVATGTNNAGVHVGGSAYFTMNGGEIKGNAKGDICYQGAEVIITGGSVENFAATPKSCTVTGGKFGDQDAAKYVAAGYAVKAIDEDPYFFEVVENLSDCPDHSAGWTEIKDASNARITKAGYYVVTADLTAGATGATVGCITVDAPKTAEVTICLNGHNLTPNGVGAGLYVRSGKVTLHNCSNTVSTITAGSNRAICVGDNSGDEVGVADHIDILTINGKNIVINGNSTNKPGIQIFREGHAILNEGTITGCTGNAVRNQGGIFEMNGGTITGNTASDGAGVLVGKASAGEDTFGSVFMNGGTISNNTSTGNGAAIHLQEGTTLTMTGGTISGNTAAFGGGIHSANSILNISGGTFTGNTSTADSNGGGAICLFSTSQITLTGGTFTNNTATSSGGAILIGSKVTANISGITTSGNTQKNGTSNGINQFEGTGVTTITGGNYGDGIYLGGSKSTISGGKFATDVSAKVVAGMGLKPIDEPPYKYEVVDEDELFSDCTTNPGVHTGWTVINDSSAYITAEGYYVLGADLTDNSQAAVTAGAATDSTTGALVINAGAGKTVTLCLNGHSINATNANKAIRIRTGNLVLCNCQAASETNPNSGKITCSKANHVIQLGINGGTRGTASLTIGDNIHVDGSQTTSGNGIIHVGNDGILTMNGGTINNNTSADKIVWLQSGQFIMNGGEISGNTATSESSNGTVLLANNGDKYAPEFNLNGGIIQNNTVGYRGGAVYLNATSTGGLPAVFNMTGGTIKDNTATNSGWDIYAMAGTFTMTGGTITNEAEEGNQIMIASNASATISGEAQIDVAHISPYGNVTISAAGVTADKVHAVAPSGKESNVTTISAGTYGVAQNTGTGSMVITGGKFGSVTGSGKITVSAGLFAEKVASSMLPTGKAMVDSGDTNYPWTVGDAPAAGDCPDHNGWTQITGAANARITKAGKYVLMTSDLAGKATNGGVDGTITVEVYGANNDVTICLNGHSITSTAGAALYVAGGNVTLCNCSATTSVISGGTTRVICVGNNSGDVEGEADRIDLLTIDSDTISVQGGKVGVQIFREGKLTLNKGAITGNSSQGVRCAGGVFVMNGGFVTNNSSYGVQLVKATTAAEETVSIADFTMNGGLISGNSAAYGAGVQIENASTFTMNDGEISNNIVTGTTNGGTVCQFSTSTFTMNGGKIINNKMSDACTTLGGVNTGNNAAFYMNGGIIGDNDGSDLRMGKTFIMTDGTIKGNLYKSWNYTDDKPTSLITTNCAISGGKFNADTTMAKLADMLATDKGMLSVIKIDEDGLAYKVAKGFNNIGEFMSFESSLAFSLYLNADHNFDSTGYENFTYSAVGAKEYDAALTLEDGKLKLTAYGIAAKEMHDKITFTVQDGSTVLFTDAVSVYDAAQEWAEDDDKAVMVADMINYAVEAEKVFTPNNVGANMNGGSDNVTGTWSSSEDASISNESFNSKIAVSLYLRERIELNIYVNSSDVIVKSASADYDIPLTTANDGAVTRITFSNINVKDVKNAVTVDLVVDGQEVTVSYSVEAYVAAASGGAQGPLMTALKKYVDSVCAYWDALNVAVGG